MDEKPNIFAVVISPSGERYKVQGWSSHGDNRELYLYYIGPPERVKITDNDFEKLNWTIESNPADLFSK